MVILYNTNRNGGKRAQSTRVVLYSEAEQHLNPEDGEALAVADGGRDGVQLVAVQVQLDERAHLAHAFGHHCDAVLAQVDELEALESEHGDRELCERVVRELQLPQTAQRGE